MFPVDLTTALLCVDTNRLIGPEIYDMLSKYDLIGVGVMLSPNPQGQVWLVCTFIYLSFSVCFASLSRAFCHGTRIGFSSYMPCQHEHTETTRTITAKAGHRETYRTPARCAEAKQGTWFGLTCAKIATEGTENAFDFEDVFLRFCCRGS